METVLKQALKTRDLRDGFYRLWCPGMRAWLVYQVRGGLARFAGLAGEVQP